MAANRTLTTGRPIDKNEMGSRGPSKLEDQMRDNLAKLQLKLMQQKLSSRQNSRSSQKRPSLNSANLRLRNAIKDRDQLLTELKYEKSKDELASSSLMLQRPYLSTDEYPHMTAVPGRLAALETGLGLDRQYDYDDTMIKESLRPRRARRSTWAPPLTPPSLMMQHPPPFYPPPFSGYPGYSPPSNGLGYHNNDMMSMMMMQNAQMNQALMQNMLMSSLTARSHSHHPTVVPEMHVLPTASSGMPYILPSLSMGQMPSSLQHPSFGPGAFPTQVPAFMVEQ